MSLPSGYIYRGIPKNIKEIISKLSHDRIKTITKSAIEGYIRSFLDELGANRDVTESVAPRSLQFISDKSFQQDMDVTKRHVQIVRMFNDIRERLPAILVVDAGVQYVPSSLGDINSATLFDNKFQASYSLLCRIPITIISVSKDQETTDQLMSLLILMFGPLKRLGGGMEITGDVKQGDSWVVRLPLIFSGGATSGVNITDDPRDQVWSAETSVEIEFEDLIRVELPEIRRTEEVKQIVNDNLNFIPIINFPDVININSKTQIRVEFFKPDIHRLVITDPFIATMDEYWQVTPRRLGKSAIEIHDVSKVQQGAKGLAPVVLVHKDFEVKM